MTRNVHSHGCGKISVALLGGAILAGAAYTEGPTILSLSVGQGVTNTLSQALAAYNTAQGTSWSIAYLNGGTPLGTPLGSDPYGECSAVSCFLFA